MSAQTRTNKDCGLNVHGNVGWCWLQEGQKVGSMATTILSLNKEYSQS